MKKIITLNESDIHRMVMETISLLEGDAYIEGIRGNRPEYGQSNTITNGEEEEPNLGELPKENGNLGNNDDWGNEDDDSWGDNGYDCFDDKVQDDIRGYQFVKNVNSITTAEHCGQNYLFMFDCRNGGYDKLSNLYAVYPNQGGNYEKALKDFNMVRMYDNGHVLLFGDIHPNPKNPGKDEIILYMS